MNSSTAPSLFLSDYLKQGETSWPTILAAKTIANTTMFMGVYETRTLAPPPDTQEGRVEGKCSCFSKKVKMRKIEKCMVQNPWVGEGGWYLG